MKQNKQVNKVKHPSSISDSLVNSEVSGIPFTHNLFWDGAATTSTSPLSDPSSASSKQMTLRKKKTNKAKRKVSTDETKFMMDASLVNILPNYTASAVSRRKRHAASGKVLLQGDLRDEDVLFGRGNLIGQHPGNIFMRQVIHLNQAYYRSVHREDKAKAADALIQYLESRGTRFLEPVEANSPKSSAYYYASYERVIEKFMQALREKITYKTGLRIAVEAAKASKKKEEQSSARLGTMLRQTGDQDQPHDASLQTESLPSAALTENDGQYKQQAKVKAVKAKGQHKAVKHSPPRKTALATSRKSVSMSSSLDSKAVASMEKGKQTKVHKTNDKPEVARLAKTKSKTKGPNTAWATIKTGDRLGIYWELDKVYYPGTVEAVVDSRVHILYDDDVREVVDLAHNKFIRWKKGLNKRLRPPVPAKHGDSASNTTSSSLSVPALRISSDVSVRTRNSTDHTATIHDDGLPVIFQGTFQEPMAVPTLSLESFLRLKLRQK